jgi:hypothetical protein
LAKYFANQTPHWPEKGKRAYHALSRGFVENELFRRTDPQKRTIGKFFDEEVAKPLKLTAHIGLPEVSLLKSNI